VNDVRQIGLSAARKERTMQYRDGLTGARSGARAGVGFYAHLTAYLLVNALLIGINLGTSTQHLWFKWPLLGWGVGILAHAIVAFALPRRGRAGRRLLREEMRARASESR
jgi:2TM domain